MIVEAGVVPQGYLPIRYGYPKEFELYLDGGEVKTAYRQLKQHYLILKDDEFNQVAVLLKPPTKFLERVMQ